MFGIRKKLLLGQSVTLIIICVLGFMTISHINRLGNAVDTILKENYVSVKACNDIIMSVDNINRNVLFAFSGIKTVNIYDIASGVETIEQALKTELKNLTVEGEKEKAEKLAELFGAYKKILEKLTKEHSDSIKENIYLNKLLPVSDNIRAEAVGILNMNQKNMDNANYSAKELAYSVYIRTLAVIGISVFLIILSGLFVTKWVLRPIGTLLESTNEIRKGNLDLVVDFKEKGELGRLSESFNDMTAALREIRDTDKIAMTRTKRTTEEIFDALPVALAVMDLEGKTAFATKRASDIFALNKGTSLKDEKYEKFYKLFAESIDKRSQISLAEKDGYIEKSVGGENRIFSITAIPIPIGRQKGEIFASAIIMEDITNIQEQKELRRDAFSSFSKRLYTPLSSLKMAIYLMINEKAGDLNEKQTELMVSARDDGEKISSILEDIIDFNLIETSLNLENAKPIPPKTLAETSVGRIASVAKDKGVSVLCEIPNDLSDVIADENKVIQVFENILSNALNSTKPGGEIKITGEDFGDFIKFRIADTGSGIDAEHLPHIFDMFYNVSDENGHGLGLSIAKEIILAHGGEIKCESEKNKGSVLEFSLKKAPAAGNPQEV